MKFALVVAAGLWSASGCLSTVINFDHCNNNGGNEHCAELFPNGSRQYCERGEGSCVSNQSINGCVSVQPNDACYSPCGHRSTLLDSGECLEQMSSTGATSNTMGGDTASTSTSGSATDTMEPMECMDPADCSDARAPFCNPEGVCVGCNALMDGDGACAEINPENPLCVGGECVACTESVPDACEGIAPVCDDPSHTCVACSDHAQCGDAGCNYFTGACLPASEIVHVGGPVPDFATLTGAIASFADGDEGTIIVHEGGAYSEAVTVGGGRVLAILANDDELPTWIFTGGDSPQLTIADGTVLLEGIQMSSNSSSMTPAILVDGGQAWVDRGRIVANLGGGILAQASAELVLRNTFVGGDVNDQVALQLDDASAELVYSTLGSGFGTAVPLVCIAASVVEIRNSLLISRGAEDEVQCGPAVITDSAAEMDLGRSNTALGNMDVLWFDDFSTGDFHLDTASPMAIATAAQWREGDPLIDIDGDPRPAIDGMPDAAGADLRQ